MKSVLINQLVSQLFSSVLPSLAQISEACYITFVTWPITKAGVDRTELVNVGAQDDYLTVYEYVYHTDIFCAFSKFGMYGLLHMLRKM